MCYLAKAVSFIEPSSKQQAACKVSDGECGGVGGEASARWVEVMHEGRGRSRHQDSK